MAKDKQFWESAKLNNATFLQYYNRLVELCISMFEWKNLPDTVDERILELSLMSTGKALFFKDNVIDEYYCLRCTDNGTLDIYGVPNNRTAMGVNGYNYPCDRSNSVIIYNNYLKSPSKIELEVYAQRLYNLDRTIDVNVNAQKTPILIVCDENEKLTMKNLYKDYSGNEPVIFGQKNLNAKNVQTLTTQAPYVSDKLYTLKTMIWNEALTYLGISNVNITKRERLITDEVTRNQGGIIASRYSRLEMRKKACREINKLFGLNIEVDYRDDIRTLDDIEEHPEEESEGNNE